MVPWTDKVGYTRVTGGLYTLLKHIMINEWCTSIFKKKKTYFDLCIARNYRQNICFNVKALLQCNVLCSWMGSSNNFQHI